MKRSPYWLGWLAILCLLMCVCSNAMAEDEDVLVITGEKPYTIVFDKDTITQVRSVCNILKQNLNLSTRVYTDEKLDETELEILVGRTNRPESERAHEGLGEYDWRISVDGKKVVVAGGCDGALIHALGYLADGKGLEVNADGYYQLPSDYDYFFDGADDREAYIQNPEGFLCNWAHSFPAIPEWLHDFEEKMAAFRNPDGRMMTTHHRGGTVYYPENSIEAVISSIQLGADTIEIDCMKTKDGVIVLMHDDTLERTTDWSLKAGKNGLPDSAYVKDWTYEQLLQLRLLSGGKESDYLIPTLEEALIVSRDRTTLRLDKWWNWDWDEDIYPLIEKTGAWRTIIIPEHLGLEKQIEVMADIKAKSGYDSLYYYDVYTKESANWLDIIASFPDNGSTPVVRWFDFRLRAVEATVESVAPYLEKMTDQVRIYVTVQQMDSGNGTNPEKPANWDYLFGIGARMMLIDNVVYVQQYIAENYQPTAY